MTPDGAKTVVHLVARSFFLFAQIFPIFLYTSHCRLYDAARIVRVKHIHPRLPVAFKTKKYFRKTNFAKLSNPKPGGYESKIWGAQTFTAVHNLLFLFHSRPRASTEIHAYFRRL